MDYSSTYSTSSEDRDLNLELTKSDLDLIKVNLIR